MPSGIYKRTEKNVPWNKGLKVGTSWHKGKKGVYSKKALKKMSDAKKGKSPWNKKGKVKITCIQCGTETDIKYSERNTRKFCGRPCLLVYRDKGLTEIRERIRNSIEYKLWRQAIFDRDGYACVWCGDNQGGNLEADHIKPFSMFPELRFALDNGRTLCKPCHRKTDTYGWKGYHNYLKKHEK